ncbi:MAG: Fic family protein [Solirubrobacterales bacterium]
MPGIGAAIFAMLTGRNYRGIEFRTNYQRYTPEMSASLLRIGTALGMIQGARILPAVADELRASARAITVHYSNLIEGNQLPLIEAERATRGELNPDSRAKVELINHVEALSRIDEAIANDEAVFTPGFLKELHGKTTHGLGREVDPDFKPRHEGEWRDGVAVVQDRLTGQVRHEGPPSEEVEARVRGLFEWLRRKLEDEVPPFVIAGVVHWGITDIHPFADGNGRAARLFQAVVLMRTGVLPGRIFSFERYYADDRAAYYAALRSVRERTNNMNRWIEYFLRGLAEEYERVVATVEDLDSLISAPGAPLRLTPSQERALAKLRLEGRTEFSRRDYEAAASVGRSTAGDDLRRLGEHGIVVPRRAGRSTRYAFATAPTPSPAGSRRGRAPKWTDPRIERELRAFLGSRTEWPTPAEFRAAGRGALYSAASRHGGIKRWRRLMGM